MAEYHIYSGMVSSGITLSDEDYMYISSGGNAENTTVNEWGGIIIFDSGTANSTTVNFNGYMYIYSGGTANSTTVNSYGHMYIDSGGTANSTTINSYGHMLIYSGGTANSTTVNDGNMRIFSGGTATNVIWTPCVGYVSAADGAYVTYASKYSGVYFGSNNQLLSHTQSMSGKVVSGSMYVSYVSATMYVSYVSATMYVMDGGVVSNTTVSDLGYMNISSGGTANCTTVNSRGYMYISSGGTANNTTVNYYGIMSISSGGTADSTTVNAYGNMYIFSGGTATNIVAESGAYLGITVAPDTYIQGTYNGSAFEMKNAYISGYTLDGTMYISSGGMANYTTVNSSGYMDIYSGGTANSTTVNSGGGMYIYSGGTATDIVAQSGAYLGITVAPDTYIKGTYNGSAFEMKNAFISSYTVKGLMYIESGGTANSTTVNGGMYIYSGGTANYTTINQGTLYIGFVNKGGAASNTTVNSGGNMHISSDGTANSTTVNSGGRMYIESGGTATDIVAQSGARLEITVAPDTYIQGTYNGSAFEMKNATITGYTVNFGMRISSGGTANCTTVNSRGYMYIASGGTANNTTINQGTLCIGFPNGGGAASNTTVNSGGSMYISSGGTANNTTVNSGGSMYISSGGIHRGSLQIASGAVVSAYSGSEIDFSIADRKASDGYLINDLSLIKGYPTYTITVSAEQEYGVYKLAQGADKFTGTVTIGDGSVDYGTITVNGADFVYNGVTYSLDQLEGDLTLTISGGAVPSTTVADDLDSNGLADVVLVHTKQGYSGAWLTTGTTSVIKWGSLSNVNAGTEILGTGKLYGSENDGQDIFFADSKSVGAWNVVDGKVTGYKSVMSINSTTNVLGLGDFNGDGATDILLRSTNGDLGYYNTDGNGFTYLKGLGKEWTVAAIGDLNGDGLDDTVLRHDAGFAGTFLTQENGTVKWASLDTLKSDMSIVGTGDFNGDGVDDVLLQNKSNGWVGAWLVEEGRVDSFIGLCKNKNAIEQIADFNGDGIDDLRIRAGADIGVLYVNGADDTTWQYFQSVGTEWDTSFAALA